MTVFKLGNNDDAGCDLKIDLRVVPDRTKEKLNVEHDVSSGEFAKYDPSLLKYQADRCKLLVEAKIIINKLVESGIDVSSIPVLQICGTELVVLDNTLVAPGLYVGQQLNPFLLINTSNSLKKVPDMAKSLTKFRNRCVEVDELIGNKLTCAHKRKMID